MDKKRMKTISELKKSITDLETKAPVQEEEREAEKNGAKNEAPISEPAEEPPKRPEEAVSAQKDIEELQRKLGETEARAAENLDKYVRTLAEFDNFRKRTTKEKATMYDSGVMDVAKSLLPVIDSFERALSSCAENERDSSVYMGMTLIYKQLRQFMEENDITEIEAVGCEFDPDVHSAVAHADDPEYGENEITEELQKGYMLKDKVLRHSMVKVAN